MLKTIALIGLAAALVVPSVPAFAVSGNSSSYGAEGYGSSLYITDHDGNVVELKGPPEQAQ